MILRRKDEIDTDAPAYIIRTRENGVVNFVKQENRLTAKVQNQACENTETTIVHIVALQSAVAYQSSEFGAAFLAKCGDGSFRLEGTMYIEGKKYRVKPAYEREGRSYGDPGSHVYVFSFVKETVHNDLQLQSLYGMRKLNIETINASRHTPEGHQH
ncbi:hypothetical protein BaRGS_00019984 [Batillaria attramentaria]|uniref:Uncharacterized protein n=1 Tax=Batillaria attramentaria TaxID=370345 RepID=A0ABD0KNU8_9CAEN